MNGKRLFFDTNAIVALLKGDEKILRLTAKSEWIGISIISFIEFLSFPGLSAEDEKLFYEFAGRINVISLDNNEKELIDSIINIRKKYRIKLPDAIIVSSAVKFKASLLTADKQLSKISEIKLIK